MDALSLIIGIVVGLVILVFLVVVHEMGHGIVAHRNGVKVEEFGIGFPPKAWGKKVKQSFLGKNVLFTVNWLPLGGFVKLQGENDDASKKGDYGAATYAVKTKILLAGVAINWLVAAVLFTVLALVGMPKIFENQYAVAGQTRVEPGVIEVAGVVKDSPAEALGLQQGDKIAEFDGVQPGTVGQLVNATSEKRGKTVQVVYVRDGKTLSGMVQLDDKQAGNLGAQLGQSKLALQYSSWWSAPIVGVGSTVQFTWETLRGIGKLLSNTVVGTAERFNFLASNEVRERGGEKLEEAGASVAGPVGIVGIIFPNAREAGLTQLTFLTAVISLTLAVMNALPIPALDGGRWFLMTLYKIRGKKLTKEREEQIVGRSFMALLLLFVLITIIDIRRFF